MDSQSVAKGAAGRVSRRGGGGVALMFNYLKLQSLEMEGAINIFFVILHDARLRVIWMWINGWSI